MKINKITTCIATLVLAIAAGCSRNADMPKPEDFVPKGDVSLITTNGGEWYARDVDGDGQFDCIVPRGSRIPMYVTEAYAQKMGYTINGRSIGKITPAMERAIIEQMGGQKELSFQMALQRYEANQK
ncbi:hypothetical protein KY310_00245 [Candidatus Woesearchaeota archaeon]|nr:hypothetical protein [Candidatus Woesearchaeota archaeon]